MFPVLLNRIWHCWHSILRPLRLIIKTSIFISKFVDILLKSKIIKFTLILQIVEFFLSIALLRSPNAFLVQENRSQNTWL